MLFKKYFRLLLNEKQYNIGQIEFLSDLVKNNIYLTMNIRNSDLNYFLQMIKIHGKQY